MMNEETTSGITPQERTQRREAKFDRHRHNEQVLGRRLLQGRELLAWLQDQQLVIQIDYSEPTSERGRVEVRLLKDDVPVTIVGADHRLGPDYARQAALGMAIGQARRSFICS